LLSTGTAATVPARDGDVAELLAVVALDEGEGEAGAEGDEVADGDAAFGVLDAVPPVEPLLQPHPMASVTTVKAVSAGPCR
jgi:hypothetical protein